jgi:hypothetical protein
LIWRDGIYLTFKLNMIKQRMTIKEFIREIEAEAQHIVSGGVRSLSQYYAQKKSKTFDYKQFREELMTIYTYIKCNGFSEDESIIIGGEQAEWDALISDNIIIEVIQALPKDAHEVRIEISKNGMNLDTKLKHMNDTSQFPDVIIQAIEQKHNKNYADKRILLISVSGEYTGECDETIDKWLDEVEVQTQMKNFESIYLVETARCRLYSIFQ